MSIIKIIDEYNLEENKLFEDIPIWVFLGIITFGELVYYF